MRSEPEIEIRDATPDDAEAIARIYNQGIEDRMATLETQLRSVEERRAWMVAREARRPVLVAMVDGVVAGWASLNAFSPRAAYDHVADISVYIARERRGQGLGRRLMDALEARARDIGYHKLTLGGFPFNEAAVHLYTRQGFQTVGVYHEQGMLDGRWVDVIVMEKLLG